MKATDLMLAYRKNKREGNVFRADSFADILAMSAMGIQSHPYTGVVALYPYSQVGDTSHLYSEYAVPLHVKGVEVGMIIRRTVHTSACAAIILTWTPESGEEGDAHVHYVLSNGVVIGLSNKLSAETVSRLTKDNIKTTLMHGIKFASITNFVEMREKTAFRCETPHNDYVRLDAFIAKSRREQPNTLWGYGERVVSEFNVLIPGAKRKRNINRAIAAVNKVTERMLHI